MKNVLRLLILAAAFGVFALPALAQDTAAGGTAASAQDVQAKVDQYQKFLVLKKGGPAEQKQAYDLGKDYLSKYAATTDADDKKIYDYVQNWVNKYEKATLDFDFKTALFPAAPAKPDYNKGFELGRRILTTDQDNLAVLLDLSIAAQTNAAMPTGQVNENISREAVQYVRRLTQLVESGKVPQRAGADGKLADSWAPFPNRDEALGHLYYTHGLLVKTTSPDEAAQLFIKAAQSNSYFKTEPRTFFFLGNAYLDGEYKRLIAEYKANFPEGKEITDDLKPKYEELLGRTNAVTDRIIDAWARAVALAANKPDLKDFRANLLKQLADVYKQRNDGKEDGLNELIASVLSKPLPLPGQPVTPAAPASTTGAAATPPPATPPAAATKPATTQASGASTTKPRRR